jgi:excinuclease ABC subunit C
MTVVDNQPPAAPDQPSLATAEAPAPWEQKAAGLPAAAGVYIFKDAGQKPLYVGKAKNLRARLRGYTREGADNRYQIRFLRARIADLDFIVTDTENEALILENNLIKKHRPPYNIRLRDDKTYYHLRLTLGEPFPRLLLARRPKKGGKDLLFGPFSSGLAVKETIRTLQQIFPLRRCPGKNFRRRERPCLNHQIGNCLGPCAGLVAMEEYGKMVEQVRQFLSGRRQDLVNELKRLMYAAAEEMEFERAAALRDRIAAIEATLERQKVDSVRPVDRDAIGWFRQGDRVVIHRLGFRGGALLLSEPHSFGRVNLPDEEVLSSFLSQLYTSLDEPPDEVLAPFPPFDLELLQDSFSSARGRRVIIRTPERGEGRQLLELAVKNAEEVFKREQERGDDRALALAELQSRLRLRSLPRWIEGVDISILGGTCAVGSVVKFLEGEPDKSGYRRYRIKSVAGADDYAMMREVLSRRLRRAQAESGPLPDLIMVDGGKGQLNVARAVLAELGIAGVDVVGLAKDREIGAPKSDELKKKGERVFLPGVKDPVAIRPGAAALNLLERVRDEAHRFALSYHKLLRGGRLRRSSLTEVPGIGPKKAAALLRAFGGIGRLRAATADEIAATPGVSRAEAETVHAFLARDREEGPSAPALEPTENQGK